MTLPPSGLPPYLHVDRRSLWHVSGLLSTALETMTLPSRLKARNGIRESLDEIASAINVNGNQNMAKLQLSIGQKQIPVQTNGDHRSGRLDVRDQSVDVRIPSQNGRAIAVKPVDDAEFTLDMDFFPSEEPSSGRGRPVTKKPHIFGQAEVIRGDDGDPDEDENDFDGQERAKRRAAGLPIIHK
jgi:hypothetical protein